MNRNFSFGNFVKEHRLAIGLTQAELSIRVGCATITIRKIEADALRPSVQIAERLAMALNIPLEERGDFVRLARTATLKIPPPSPTPTPPPLPEEIGDEDLSGRAVRGYELGERIGSGGFGAVYRATQPVLEREVAIKIILPKHANHPDFIRRFEAEAQLVARLEHPYIVPLYDYWREPNAAYLVMRLLRGGSLQDLLEQGPVPLQTVLRMMEQICLALHSAHRFGVIHRDIKPANIFLDEDENAYLADFGIAKNLGDPNLEDPTQVAALVGSPAYISPEQIRAELVKPQADVYCLGVMIFELLTGKLPFQGPTPIDYIQQHLSEPFPPLAKYDPDLPPALDLVILRSTAKDPNDRHPDALSLLANLRAVVSGAMDVTAGVSLLEGSALEAAEVENPYKGLRAFGEGDAADFFGRETLIQELLGRMAEENDISRFLAVVGPSGIGKSSAVKAGLIPALRRGGLPGSENWFVVDFMPGAHPIEELEAALLRVAVKPPESLLGQLQESERGLLRAVRRILPPDEQVELALVIDQFEEVFTLVSDEAVRVHFLDSLLAAVLEPRSRVRVVVTMRADFIDKPLSYVDFGELVRQRTEFVLPLTPDELEFAITGPARRVGLVLEPGLVNRIIHDVSDQPGGLPLLQYALTELFERRQGRRLTLAAYNESGGVLGALGRRAEEIYSGLDTLGREAARQTFLRLVTLGEGVEDTRRRVLRSEVLGMHIERSSEKSFDAVLDNFGRHRLFTFDHDPVTRGPTVEVAHEALLRGWPRLRAWLDESRVDVRMQRVLGNAAAEWLGAERDASFLLRGSRLDQFEGWVAETGLALTADEHAFLNASLEERRAREAEEAKRQAREVALEQRSRRFLRALVGVFAVAAVVALVLSVVAFNQRGIAQENALIAGQNAATATFAQGEALLLADSRATQQTIAEAEAYARATAQAEAEAAEEDALRQAAIGLASQAELQMIGPNPERAILLALEAVENYPYTWQGERSLTQAVLKHKLSLDLHHGAGDVNSAELSPDGKRIMTTGDFGLVKVWNASTGEELLSFRSYEGDDTLFGRALWSPSGNRILTWAVGGPRVWDATSGEQLLDLSDHGHYAGDWSPDGSRILTWFSSQEDTALVWDAETGELLFALPEPEMVWSAHWSPDGTKIITNNGIIWDADTGVQLRTISEELQTSPADSGWPWSPDGKRVVSAGIEDPLRIWDAETGEELVVSSGAAGARTGRWSPSGDRIITFDAESEQPARVWDTDKGEELYQLLGALWGSWSPDGRYILTGGDGGETKVWDAASGSVRLSFTSHSGSVRAKEWFPSGERFITTSGDGSAKVWDVSQMLSSLGCQPSCPDSPVGGWFSGAAWSPDGQKVARGFVDGTATVWDVATGEVLLRVQYEPLAEHMLASGVVELHWSPDGKRLLGGCGDGVARVWDAVSGEELLRLQAHDIAALVRAFWSPDGRRIVTVSEFVPARVWDAITGEELLTFGEHTPYAASWSPDGSRIVTSDGTSTGGGAKVWDATTGEELLDLFPEDFGFGVSEVAWSPDGGRIIAFSDDQLGRVFDANSGEELLTFPGRASAWGAKWSPSGDRILIGGMGGAVKVFDVDTGNDLINYEIGAGAGANWSPDGKQIAISDWDGNLSIYPAWQSLGDLIKYARECCVFRQLTTEERDQFGLAAKP